VIHIPNRKPNQTPVARQFSAPSPARAKLVPDPCPIRPQSRMPTLRLSFNSLTDKRDVSIEELTHTLMASGLKGTILFPDTGFITTPIQPSFWRAAHAFSLGFSQMTVGELTGWMATPIGNEYLHTWLPRALQTCQSEPLEEASLFRFCRVLGTLEPYALTNFEVAIADRAKFEPFGYDYYVNLLSLRKRLGIVANRELQDILGRDATDSELKQHLHNKHHARVAPLALKGCRDFGKRNYLHDEELVVTAVMTAILTGRETVILTRDNDVFDQFVKLMELIIEDYHCYRWANVHFLDPSGCPMYPIAIPPGHNDESGFQGDAFDHVVVPIEEVEGLPPYEFKFVNTYCVLVGNSSADPKISQAGCCLEREMGHLLEAKGKNGGRNTVHFGQKNVVSRMNAAADGNVQVMFFLAEEQYTDYEGVNVSRMDLRRGLSSDMLVVKRYFKPSELAYPVS
jgi:hypothetical protein